MQCQYCSSELKEGAQFCNNCGAQVNAVIGTWKCGNCEAEVSREFYNCTNCGDSYELSPEYLIAHPEVKPFEAEFVEEDGVAKTIFSKIFIFLFMGAMLVGIIWLFNLLMG